MRRVLIKKCPRFDCCCCLAFCWWRVLAGALLFGPGVLFLPAGAAVKLAAHGAQRASIAPALACVTTRPLAVPLHCGADSKFRFLAGCGSLAAAAAGNEHLPLPGANFKQCASLAECCLFESMADSALTPCHLRFDLVVRRASFHVYTHFRTSLESLTFGAKKHFSLVALMRCEFEIAEPSVRAELMEQVPHVAMYCHEEKDEHHWMHLVPSFLLPLVVRYLTDINNQVRAALVSIDRSVFSFQMFSLALRCARPPRRRFSCSSNSSSSPTTTSRSKCARCS